MDHQGISLIQQKDQIEKEIESTQLIISHFQRIQQKWENKLFQVEQALKDYYFESHTKDAEQLMQERYM